jgi:hypothetical protein
MCLRIGDYMTYHSEKQEYSRLESIWGPVCKASATSLTLLTGHLSSWQQQQEEQQQEQEQQQLPRFYQDDQVQYVVMQWGSHAFAHVPAEGMQS